MFLIYESALWFVPLMYDPAAAFEYFKPALKIQNLKFKYIYILYQNWNFALDSCIISFLNDLHLNV